MTLADLLARFDDVEHGPDGFLVHCPAHEDSHQSLRFAVSDQGKILARCRAGCETAKVVAALGLTMRDLARMTPGDVVVPRATSTDVPAAPADVARLAVTLDRYAATLAGARLSHDPIVGAAFDYAEERFGLSGEDRKSVV